MPSIATLTMNPALDIASTTARIIPGEKLRCTVPRYDPGGGGINVARAIHKLGGEAIAMFPAGGPMGELIKQLLHAENVICRPVPIAGLTRESFTIDEQQTGRQFRFVMPGPSLSADDADRCLDELASLSSRPEYVVMSGSLAPGMTSAFSGRVAERTRRLGARLILDSSGAALRNIARGDVYLLKPNLKELRELLGREIVGPLREEEAARELIARRIAEIVVISLGRAGAILSTEEGCWRFNAPIVPVASTVGAGDSMVAGIVFGLTRGETIVDAVRYGMAAGAAALMLPGTELCQRNDTERLFAKIAPPAPCG
ncbi:MAG: 1-phosphofructokinase family hexose kinase [Alphaproteobacteria bacterium]|nr:1-phosphofructokinase family hexose kinase [Alphaproteobacteria bacterium]